MKACDTDTQGKYATNAMSYIIFKGLFVTLIFFASNYRQILVIFFSLNVAYFRFCETSKGKIHFVKINFVKCRKTRFCSPLKGSFRQKLRGVKNKLK